MNDDFPTPLDLRKLRVYPLKERRSLTAIENLNIKPESDPGPCPDFLTETIKTCAAKIKSARQNQSSVILMYGAHLVKNGAMGIVNGLVEKGWLTHLATNGAGTIHDWELAFLGRTEESVRDNVATGKFGAWDETGKFIHLALLAGALKGEGYGRSLGRFIQEDGITLPSRDDMETVLRENPAHPLAPARAELLQAIIANHLPAGRLDVVHSWKQASVLANAFKYKVPLTVHPGIGYDIISNHPIFNGAAIGRAADLDFRLFARAVEGLDGGVVLSIGSAVMAPQVFEKSLSCVNNLRLQENRKIVRDHRFFVVDLADGGNWDWAAGEPPKTSPAYYLRFCKSFARMGGQMTYSQADNRLFLHHLWHALNR
jgi:hypothetical protein